MDGTSFGTADERGVSPIPVTWARRNRLTETTPLAWDDPDVTPEAGQTTTLKLREIDGTLIDDTSYTGIAGTSQNVDPADFLGAASGYIEFVAVRDGYESWQSFSIPVLLSTSLLAEPGSYLFSGSPVTLRSVRKVVAAAGSYAFTGTDATLHASATRLAAAAGSYAFTGTAAALKHSGMISAGAGSYAFTGTAATLTLFADASGAAGQVMGLLAGITKAN